jgi:hypothetical protein
LKSGNIDAAGGSSKKERKKTVPGVCSYSYCVKKRKTTTTKAKSARARAEER